MRVLMIHGLSRTPISLLGLERHLQQAGYETEQFGYVAFAETFDHITLRLRDHLKRMADQGNYGVVAHSLGGLLVQAALSQMSPPLPVHLVMLGTPNNPSRLAKQAWKLLPFRWLTGQCGFNLTRSDFFNQLPPLKIPYTIIAGTGGPTGPWSPFGRDANDGIVAVYETRLSAQDRIIELPVWHTFMMNDATVQTTIVKALQSSQPHL